MRNRYRYAANAVTAIGAVAGLLLVIVVWPKPPGIELERHFLLAALTGVVAFALGPRLIVQTLWRLQRQRNHELWG